MKRGNLSGEQREMRRHIVRLALPNIVSNITVPLLSLVDVGLAGHLESGNAIGAVAIASGSLNTLYWLFGFLRMGTTGYVAQSFGRSDVRRINLYLVRGLFMALVFGVLLTFATPFVTAFAHFMAQNESGIGRESEGYIHIALLGAPAALALYVLNGWFIGMQNTRAPMATAIFINVLNIAISYSLVTFGGRGVDGLATGTVVAQYAGVLLLCGVALIKYRRLLRFARITDAFSTEHLGEFLGTGRDIFVRSLLLSAVTLFFTYASVGEGALTVAANTVLLQLFSLFSYFTDGFAYAAEALTGRYLGQKREDKLRMMVRMVFRIAFVATLATTMLYFFLPKQIIGILSDKPEVIDTAMRYAYWVALVPLSGFAAFIWDGIFVGATYSRGLLWSIVAASAIFFALYYSLQPIWGNHAIWFAFDMYLLTRGVMQYFLWKRFHRTIENEEFRQA